MVFHFGARLLDGGARFEAPQDREQMLATRQRRAILSDGHPVLRLGLGMRNEGGITPTTVRGSLPKATVFPMTDRSPPNRRCQSA
jgi:hypothetical protein